MALYVVYRENPYFKLGTYLEELIDPEEYDPDFEVDVPEQAVQPVQLRKEGNRAVPSVNYGIALPLWKVRPYLIKILKKGLDKTW